MPTPFRHTEPLPPKAATGRVAEVYAQAARDFGIPEPAPFVALSSAPALLAPAWALMRESLLAGPGDRTGKEVAAFGVSQANKCRFCVDAHTMLLHATGDHALAERLARGQEPADERHARVLDWARRTRVPGAAREPYPFPPEEAPGYLGTVLAFAGGVSSTTPRRALPGDRETAAVRRASGLRIRCAAWRRRSPVPMRRTDAARRPESRPGTGRRPQRRRCRPRRLGDSAYSVGKPHYRRTSSRPARAPYWSARPTPW
ncbi:hypothetical protein STENM36S_03779 [Streptomyces tendae]